MTGLFSTWFGKQSDADMQHLNYFRQTLSHFSSSFTYVEWFAKRKKNYLFQISSSFFSFVLLCQLFVVSPLFYFLVFFYRLKYDFITYFSRFAFIANRTINLELLLWTILNVLITSHLLKVQIHKSPNSTRNDKSM